MAESKTILIAEDTPDEVFLMRRVFAQTGLRCELRFVSNGQEAIDYLERKPPYNEPAQSPLPSAIILDLKMPLLDGFEVLAWLKLQPTLSSIPTVVHTSSAMLRDRERAKRLGARDYFVKGTGLGDLMMMFNAVADRWLNPTAGEPGPASANGPVPSWFLAKTDA
jgi:CheY-like chemotaxis protein